MATKAQKIRASLTPKFMTRKVRRCWRCGRRHGYLRMFNLCRICVRELANAGQLPGVRKSSW